ncbi:MAG: hypothetical protein WBI34_06490 [Tenuifilaceae bacterium]|jgi:cell division protein FtsQ|nr:hypothetical protein [Bacteroidales bacterium]MDI9515879.1 hypothetical protein [Bacteroidota bacterium]NLH56128.1 hypothetical protein [Rikenellaceae bacterium]OQC62145.1 MAG: Cell division protein FtsQ [Bacteroidetes bacterium ADurb.Bin008]HNV81575.1 hypothetical protein [Tenuifilaceae bacterium]
MKQVRFVLGVIKWLLVAAYLVVALSFVSSRSQQVVCSDISINISDSLENAFITKQDVKNLIAKQHKNLVGIPLHMINTYELEQALRNFQTVKNAEVYSVIDGTLNIRINQRKPILRIINSKGQNYYIDSEGQVLPLSGNFAAHVLVANGNIVEPFTVNSKVKITEWCVEANNNIPLICKLLEFANYVTRDKFWNAQIAQIYVDSPSRIELIPRVGAHTILMGSLDDYELKLKKLRLFYETALPEEGWNKYRQINLKYSNQIVCTKK